MKWLNDKLRLSDFFQWIVVGEKRLCVAKEKFAFPLMIAKCLWIIIIIVSGLLHSAIIVNWSLLWMK